MTRNRPSEPYLSDPDVTLYCGDALEVLRELPDESVHCIATSPPFYALRDYGVEGQIGLESTPEEWAERLVGVFREARRVLRRDGTLWVECGDSYASGGMGGASGASTLTGGGGRYREGSKLLAMHEENQGKSRHVPGHKPKDLLGTPWLLAFALRADGWWLRGCNIWAKPNAMPESAKDRCTTAHSYVFQFARSARYFFDGDAISEPAAWERWGDQTVPKHEGTETAAGWIKPKTKAELQGRAHGGASGVFDRVRKGDPRDRRNGQESPSYAPTAKHPRSVWQIPTQGFPEAHFATWPEALARRIILAACPEQVCSVCGKARERIVERGGLVAEPNARIRANEFDAALAKTGEDGSRWANRARDGVVPNHYRPTTMLGFTDCGHSAYVPGTVLDPFAGSGTTLYVARKLGRRGVGIDLNPEYLDMAARRLQQQSLFAQETA